MKRLLIYATLLLVVSVSIIVFISPALSGPPPHETHGYVSPNELYSNNATARIGVGSVPDVTAYNSGNTNTYVANSIHNYTVKFTQTGLPPGMQWAVTLNGTQKNSTSNISFKVPSGTYLYTVRSLNDTYSPEIASSYLTVNGSAIHIVVAFKPVTSTVTVHETGLPSGTSWSFTLGNYINTSTTSTMTFSVVNGTYAFMPGSVNGYQASQGGVLKVSGSPKHITVHYKVSTYTLTVEETGLASGNSWNISLNGHVYGTNSTSLNIQLTDGTYTVNVTGPSGYNVSVQSTLTVNNSNLSLSVTFTKLQNTSPTTTPQNSSNGPKMLLVELGAGISVGAALTAVVVMFVTGTGIFRKRGKGGNP